MQQGKFNKLLKILASGVKIDWSGLYNNNVSYPRRISAPGYPFIAQRRWIEKTVSVITKNIYESSIHVLHLLLHKNISTLQNYKFKTRLSGNECF